MRIQDTVVFDSQLLLPQLLLPQPKVCIRLVVEALCYLILPVVEAHYLLRRLTIPAPSSSCPGLYSTRCGGLMLSDIAEAYYPLRRLTIQVVIN